ncbi:MAG: hypothetical protein OEZ59_01700 [Deltaproteobacteria bacterium]|nr:hypothetical protein [Deltaproteobacteria bacterium]
MESLETRLNLYFDLLVVYLLVGSSLGDCELYRDMGRALASGSGPRMQGALNEFHELSSPLRRRIAKGDEAFEPFQKPQPVLHPSRLARMSA